ncbi:MAG: glutamate--tRNA ligase [bacterium]
MVRTRFAPSPTGYLHIGGVRTALFNWLFARSHGGSFVLRIDDTDRERNLDDALRPILAGLRWLGLDWDEGPEVGGAYGPYRQSERAERHQAAVRTLLERGFAYVDYARTEEMAAERAEAEAAGRPFVYSRRFAAAADEDRRRFEAEGRAGAVRLKMPREGACRFTDLVRGEVEVEWVREADHVVQRADGTCLYHLASVADDRDMRITHVIRAEEHLSNTPRQIFIAEGLGMETPAFAHLPFVAEPGSRNKLSKRKLKDYLHHPDFKKLYEHGLHIAERLGRSVDPESFNPVLMGFYEDVGYLPEALANYLVLLGWSLDDKTEDFTREEMIRHFSLERVGRSPASLDPGKLLAFEGRRMQEVPGPRKVELCLPFLVEAKLVAPSPAADVRACVARIVEAAGDRLRVAGDVLDYADFFVADDALAYDDASFDKRLVRAEGANERLARFRERLARASLWSAPALEGALTEFVASEGVNVGAVIHALRVAVTGKAVGFGMFETLEILGRERVLARIDRALARVRAGASERRAAGRDA